MTNDAPVSATFGERLGLDYELRTLDCVVEIAHAVALHSIDHPHRYRQVPDPIAEQLTNLQANYGYQADFPNQTTRDRLWQPIFGGSDAHGSGNDGSAFQTYRLPVLVAAATFAESIPTQTAGYPALRKRVQGESEAFLTQMTRLQGASLSQTEKRIGFIFSIAQSVLRGSAGVFGIQGIIDSRWPLEQPRDPLGAELIEQITTQLPDLPYGVISIEMFVHIQQIARDGFQSIRDILDKDVVDPNFDVAQLDQLIAALYAWGSDLRLVGGVLSQQQPPRMAPPVVVGMGTAPTVAQLRPPTPAMLSRAVARQQSVYGVYGR